MHFKIQINSLSQKLVICGFWSAGAEDSVLINQRPVLLK